ncbi:hypothetical protein GCM10027059_39280 [Myceligenerans halotolerans]
MDTSVWRVLGDDGGALVAPTASGVLDGETVAVKDLFAVAGQRVGAGNPAWLAEAPVETAHAPAVARLLEAGASVAGIARTEEFAWSLTGANAHYGTPPNPAAPGRISGGSTSGPATAVAGGEVSIGLGTDTSGSIRVPAAYQGLWGFRPTHGAISGEGVLPLAPSFDTVGWLSRDPGLLARVGDVLLPLGGTAAPDREARPASSTAAHTATADMPLPPDGAAAVRGPARGGPALAGPAGQPGSGMFAEPGALAGRLMPVEALLGLAAPDVRAAVDGWLAALERREASGDGAPPGGSAGTEGRTAPGEHTAPGGRRAFSAGFTISAAGTLGRGAQDAPPFTGLPEEWVDAVRVVQAAEAWAEHGEWIAGHLDGLGSAVRGRFEFARSITADQAAEARGVAAEARSTIRGLFGGDLLVLPAASSVALPAGDPGAAEAVRAATVALCATVVLGGLPALTVPLRTADGLPTAACLVGPPGSDRALLALATELVP